MTAMYLISDRQMGLVLRVLARFAAQSGGGFRDEDLRRLARLELRRLRDRRPLGKSGDVV